MDKFRALDAFSLRLAVGAVWLVAAFLAVCGIYNIFPFVEALVDSSTWAALVALPVLAVSYSLGAIVANASSQFAMSPNDRLHRISRFVSLNYVGTSGILSRLDVLQTEAEFLHALVPTAVFLAASVIWSSVRVLSGGERVACVMAALVLVGATPVLLRLARGVDEQTRMLVEAALAEASRIRAIPTAPGETI